MPVPTDITAGTLTITNGSTAVTGVGTAWLASDLRQGDIILWIEGGDGFQTPILADVPASNTALTLVEPWEGPTLTGVRYRIRYQWDSSRVSAQSRQLIEMLDNGNVLALSGLTGPGVPVFDGPHSMVIKPETDFINGVAYDVQVDTLADRAAYDGQAEGFAVLVSDVGDGRSALYSKVSNAVGDWSDPAYITGGVGLTPDIEATVTNTAPGTTPTVTPVPITGGTRLDFTLPEASGFYNAGVYDIGAAYTQDQVVRHNGSSFIALQAVPIGESPSSSMPPVDTAYWQVLAAKGMDGTGTGDVVGPASSVDGRLVVFDGVSGKLIKEAGDLSEDQKAQARSDIGARRGISSSDYIFSATNKIRNLFASGTGDATIREIGNVLNDPSDTLYPYKMVYSGHTGAYVENNVYIFGARSSDGLNWEKTGQIISPRSAEDPYLVKVGSTYYLYVEDKQAVPFRNVRLYTAADFSGPWTDRGDVLTYGAAGSWNSADVSSPVVWVEDTTWYMIFEGRKQEGPPYQSGAIGIATSADGIVWVQNPSNPIITGSQTARGPAGWAAWLVPDDIRKVDGVYYLYHHGVHWNLKIDGNGFNRFACGVLTSTDLVTWRDPVGNSINSTINDTLMLFELGDQLYLTGSEGGSGIQLYQPLESIQNNFRGILYPGAAPAFPSATYVKLPMSFIMTDSFNGWDQPSSEWYAIISGLYEFNGLLNITGSPSSLVSLQYVVNGTEIYNMGSHSEGNNITISGSDQIYLDRGDRISFRAYSATAVASGNAWAKINISLVK